MTLRQRKNEIMTTDPKPAPPLTNWILSAHRVRSSAFRRPGPAEAGTPNRSAGRPLWPGMFLVAALGLGVTGCQSFKAGPPPGALASVTITNRSVADVTQAARAVFAVHGFEEVASGPGQFTFERAGTRMNNLAYGSEMFNEVVTIRVIVTVTPLNLADTAVSCAAWLVEAADDPVFQDDHKVRKLRKWPYEQLLNDIKGQLGE